MAKILKIISRFAFLFDIIFLPITIIGAIWFRLAKYWGLDKVPITEKILLKIGVIPIVNHYYEPFINPDKIKDIITKKRTLSGLKLNIQGQLNLLSKFTYQDELMKFSEFRKGFGNYNYDNGSFNSGDSDFLYSIIRHLKPNNIVEVGSGNSTLMSLEAIKQNKIENPLYTCKMTCVEPFENPWLKKLDVSLVRGKIEEIDINFLENLKENDILFIDSSHVIRTGGDVVFEILEILPKLNKGVLIHFHDIFTPNEYPYEWFKKHYRFWDEQYLLEAFLSHNDSFEVVAALNFLANNHFEALSTSFPILNKDKDRQPGSFWIRKIK